MSIKHWRSVAALSLSLGLVLPVASAAQGVPAEVPSSSYTGDQYIDSRGCVFVRVGFGAATEWVPRVGRDRNQVCGQTPTSGVARTQPDLTAENGVTVIGGAAPVAAAPAPAPAPTPAPTAPVIVAAPVVAAPQVPAARPAPVTVQAPQATTGCPDLPAAHQPYFTGEGVRCGPQAHFPGTPGPQSSLGGAAAEPRTGTPRSFALSAPPPGYEVAWDDGRLNPYRGLGTPTGQAQMEQVWTNTVPRRLASVPITRGTQVLTRRQAAAAALAARTAAETPATGALVSAGTRSTRSRVPLAAEPTAPVANEVRVGAGHRHVLAGTFRGEGDASNAYQRLAATGLPARIGRVERQGQTLFVVMAGPYDDPQSLGRALVQARGAGFSGAITRN